MADLISITEFFTSDLFNLTIGVLGAFAVVFSAVTSFTTLSALTQMGSIQERTASWSHITKKPMQHIQQLEKTILNTISSNDKDNKKHHDPHRHTSPEQALASVKTKDKITYTVSVINMLLTAFIAGAKPEYFWVWHFPKMALYITHRWWTFKQTGHHYLLFDFCYWLCGLQAVSVLLFPDNDMIFRMSFILANGPVGWAVISFSQSLILHSVPHMTSVFIHTSPVVLSYCIRWHAGDRFKVCDNWPQCKEVTTWQQLFVEPMYFYLAWVVLYYIFIYLIMDSRIRSRGYKTLFDRIISRGPTKNIAKLSQNEMVQKTIYMMTHVVFASSTMLLATVYYRSQVAHFIFMFCILAASGWNASTFYFSVFLNQYQEDLEKRAGIEDNNNNKQEGGESDHNNKDKEQRHGNNHDKKKKHK